MGLSHSASPSQIRTGGFPAYGSLRRSPRGNVSFQARVRDTRSWQREPVHQRLEPLPCEPSLTPPIKGAEPDAPHVIGERLQRPEVAREAEIGIVAPQHLT